MGFGDYVCLVICRITLQPKHVGRFYLNLVCKKPNYNKVDELIGIFWQYLGLKNVYIYIAQNLGIAGILKTA